LISIAFSFDGRFVSRKNVFTIKLKAMPLFFNHL
jgi:hypothetical protein